MLGTPVALLWVVWGQSWVLGGKVNKHKPWIESSYHGVISENMEVVLLDPPLVALDKDAPIPYAGEICGFRLQGPGGVEEAESRGEGAESDVEGAESVFEAVVVNRTSGAGVLRARRPLDCEVQKEFTFTIQAYDCGAGPNGDGWKKSHKAVVHVQVNDVNEFSPVFRQQVYAASVMEGRIYDNIVQVEAWDQDCSPQYSQICNYDIITQDTPFAIDRNGNIRNTEHLVYDRRQDYQLQVTAYDCGQKRALQSAAVHIHVKAVCKPGWQGWTKRLDYEPGTGGKALFPRMQLETCGAPLSGVRVAVELQNGHIGTGCDRDTYSQKSLEKLCGAASGSADLLPAPSVYFNWTSSLLTDGGRDLIFQFSGSQAANIPDWVLPQNLTDQFTMATWMKHGPSTGLRGDKETILCNSDKTEMNRHHYSLYVHNCRLVLLLRRDFTQEDSFRPAEYHWRLEQMCDEEWHYYIISVQYPSVALLVDGVTFDPYLVTDDWPLPPSHVHTQLTVGACWQGGEQASPRFSQFFRGSLSGLTVRPGRMETRSVLACLQACQEGLDLTSLGSLARGIKFHFNPSQSVLVMEGEDVESVAMAMTKVSYINARQFPTPGHRTLHISTTAQCFGEEPCVSVAEVRAVVVVLPPSQPRITLAAPPRPPSPPADLRRPPGLALFKQLRITSTVTRGDVDTPLSAVHRPGVQEVMHNLDYCDVVVLGEELDPGSESLELSHRALLGKHLDATNSTSGISIYGVDSMAHYEQALRQLRYRNWVPAGLTDRRFRLTCSELNGRYTSNELVLEVSVLHSSAPVGHVNHMAVQSQYMRPVHHPLMIHTFNSHISGTPPAATVVIVVCIAALVAVVVLGVYRIHSTHQEGGEAGEEGGKESLTWDDSTLTITINPMENVAEPQAEADETREENYEDDEEEEEEKDEHAGDSSSAESDDSDEEEEEDEDDEEEERAEQQRGSKQKSKMEDNS